MTYVHPECGFQNPEAANYCSKCGALLIRDEQGAHTTMTFTPEEEAEDESLSLDTSASRAGARRPGGGGRAGETFALEHDRTSLGRGPECEVLDDVTVSRRHSVITRGPTASPSTTRAASTGRT